MPSQYQISGYYRPPAKRRSDGVLLAGRYWPDFTCLLGIRRLITSSSDTKAAKEILDEQPMLMRACVSEHSLLAYEDAFFEYRYVLIRELYMHALNITARQDLMC